MDIQLDEELLETNIEADPETDTKTQEELEKMSRLNNYLLGRNENGIPWEQIYKDKRK